MCYSACGIRPIFVKYNTTLDMNSKRFLFLTFASILFSFKIQAQLTFEAENAILTGTQIGTSHSGYSGTGYITDFTQRGDKLTLEIDISSEGNYVIEIGYSSPYGDKTNDIYLDGQLITSQVFPKNTNWTSLILDGTKNIKAGKHSLEVRHNWGYMEFDYFSFSKIVGQIPVIRVKDVASEDTGNDGTEMITIDASKSSDADGQIISYVWTFEGNTIGNEAMITYTFPKGENLVSFTITDNDGNQETKNVKIIIADLTNNGHNRLPIRNGELSKFMSGINIAWNSFANDLTNFDAKTFTTFFNNVENSGGNAVRWWLHTNGVASPTFGSDGKVTGLRSGEIKNMKAALDMAAERGIMVSMCLWSFDMLQDQGNDRARNKRLLEDASITQSYIDNALIPILKEIGDHPAVMSWEVFNEPEGMTSEFGWSTDRTEMKYVQQFVNLVAGAIHRQTPTALVSNGSWSFIASTDVSSFIDYYRDDRLIAVGGDTDGTLDFVQVHYYDHFSEGASPFAHAASYWGIDKPIVIGEFPANGVKGYNAVETFEQLYKLGYAGAMTWSWSDTQFGGLTATSPALQLMEKNYPDDIIIEPIIKEIVEEQVLGIERELELSIYPNPTMQQIAIQFPEGKNYEDINLEIINSSGAVVLSKSIQLNLELTENINVSNLVGGIYILHISDNAGKLNSKFRLVKR
jgi:hypothetical protein